MARVSDEPGAERGARGAGGAEGRADSPRARHRALHLLGQPPGAGPGELRAHRGDHRRRQPGSDPRARAHRVREGLQPALPASAHRASGGDRHGDRHPAGRQLAHGLTPGGPREQRDRHDEHPRRLHRRGFAGAQVHLQELDPLLRVRAGRSGVLHRGDAPAASAALGPRARHRRGRAGGERVRRAEPRRHGDRAALRQRARARRGYRVHAHVPPAAGADGARLRPSAPVRARGRRRARPRARRLPRHTRRLQRGRRRGAGAVRDHRPARQAALAGPSALGHGPGRGPAAPARLPDPRRGRQPASLRARSRQPAAQGHRLPLRLHDSRDRAQAGRAPSARSGDQGRRADLHVRARGRGVPALEPLRAARALRGARAAWPRIASRWESSAAVRRKRLRRFAGPNPGDPGPTLRRFDSQELDSAASHLMGRLLHLRGTQSPDCPRRRGRRAAPAGGGRLRPRPRELGRDRRRGEGRRRGGRRAVDRRRHASGSMPGWRSRSRSPSR